MYFRPTSCAARQQSLLTWLVLTAIGIPGLLGCGQTQDAGKTASAKKPASKINDRRGQSPPTTSSRPTQPPAPGAPEKTLPRNSSPAGEAPNAAPADQPVNRLERPLRASRRPLDLEAARKAGIRRLTSRRLTLLTDVAADAEVDALPELFDQAFGGWCEYFQVDPAEYADWRMTGFLMQDREKFVATGLLPDTIPNFRNGYSIDHELWLVEQPTPYYRRHLLLHEGTHGFMNTIFGAGGPPWYMEGTAELLATHALENGDLKLRHFPASREEVPMLGRIKLVQDGFAQGRAMSVPAILNYDNRAHLENEPYAWCWALTVFLDTHPRYRQRFKGLLAHVHSPDFNALCSQAFADDWSQLEQEWTLFVGTLEHGHAIAATAIDFTPGKPLVDMRELSVAVDRGWQNTGVRVEQGRRYRITAEGRYQIAADPKPWWCEPGGVTVRYYRRRPLGMLLGAVLPDDPLPASPFLMPTEVGLGTTLIPQQSGTLYLGINDSPGELHDNAGQVKVVLETLADSADTLNPAPK